MENVGLGVSSFLSVQRSFLCVPLSGVGRGEQRGSVQSSHCAGCFLGAVLWSFLQELPQVLSSIMAALLFLHVVLIYSLGTLGSSVGRC